MGNFFEDLGSGIVEIFGGGGGGGGGYSTADQNPSGVISNPAPATPEPVSDEAAAVLGGIVAGPTLGGATGSSIYSGVRTTAAVATLGLSLYQTYEAREASKDAEAAAKAAAQLEALMTAEQVVKLEEENIRTVATARAKIGASGLSGASSEIYISALEEVGRQDVEWLKAVGVSRYDQKITEGEAASSMAESQMWGYLGQGITSAASLWDSGRD